MTFTTGLEGKVALVTGGSRGIGKAVASAMAANGVRLAICARDEPRLQQVAEEIRVSSRADIIAVKTNMTKVNDIQRFVAAAMSKFGKIDILVNNAGGAHSGGIMQTTDEDLEYHVQLKLLGYIRAARAVIPHMKAGGGGKIINIAGMTGKEPSPSFLVAGITNAGLLNFTKALSKELESDGIVVNSVNPGTTDTPFTEETFKAMGALVQLPPEELHARASRATMYGRMASPGEIASAVLYLASNVSGFVNGISINVDAGRSSGLW